MPVELVHLASATSACLRFIDPYGDAVFDQLQMPVLIGEIRHMRESVDDEDLRERLDALVAFLEAPLDVHTCVRFLGD